VKRWLALAYLWSTLALSGCTTVACAARQLTSAKPAPAAVEKPSILLRVTPQVAHAPAQVRITVLVNDPGGVLHCPSFEIDMGDGAVSGRAQTCPPSDPVQEGYALNIKPHTYREGGAFVVTVRVLVGGQQVMVETQHVLMIGPDDDPNMRTALR
jgi:hypothetical protein